MFIIQVMHLAPDEKIILTVYHHYMPFVITVLQLCLVGLPFYILVYFLVPVLSFKTLVWANLFISVILLFAIIYSALIYWLDKLVITNKRVLFIDWKFLTVKIESEALLADIQDVVSVQNGILSFLPSLHFGTLIIKTSAHSSNVEFPQAPRPDILRKFITRIMDI